MKLHLYGGWRDGQTIDLDDPQWGWEDTDLAAGILPPTLTIDITPDRMTTYRLVKADAGEGWYEIDPVLTAKARAELLARTNRFVPRQGGGRP